MLDFRDRSSLRVPHTRMHLPPAPVRLSDERGCARRGISAAGAAFGVIALLLLWSGAASPVRGQSLATHDALTLHVPGGGATVGLAAGYGFFEAGELMEGVSEAGAHHRFNGALFGAYQFGDWARVRLSYAGAYDKHPSLDGSSDWGGMLAAAGGADVWMPGASLGLGAGLLGFSVDLSLPGGDGLGASPSSLVLDATTRVQWQEAHSFVGLIAGFRFDRSITSLDRPEQYGVSDRISLQGSESHGVLAAVSAGMRFGGVDATLGVQTTALLGGEPLALWPTQAWLGAGAADDGLDGWYWFAKVAASPQTRPSLSDAIVRVMPRAEVTAGLRYRFGAPSPTHVDAPADEGPPATEATTQEEVEAPAVAPPAERTVTGRVVDDQDQPIEGAFVQILRPKSSDVDASAGSVDATEAEFEQVQAVEVGADGAFTLEALPPGPLRLELSSENHETVIVDIAEGAISLPETFPLTTRVPHGELTGLVRDFNGEGIAAVVVVRPGQERIVLPRDGTFSLKLPPGRYTVRIAADGFVSQTRRIELEDRSVVVLNVELRAARSRR